MALVMRKQPITAYQIGKEFEASPVHTLNTSKGTLYPLLHRLERHGFLRDDVVSCDKRGTRRYSCTPEGERALRNWVLTIRPEHELLHDPLRKKLQGFELLNKKQQIEWIHSARSRLERKLQEVESWPIENEGPFGALVQRSAKDSLLARLAWLDAALKLVVTRRSRRPTQEVQLVR